ncbi:MAG: transcriptional repressor [Firmicutes bacterium]|nr:transcriptional repressor [Bacillota bacterium]
MKNSEGSQALLEEAASKLRQAGYKLTRPRRVIMEWFYRKQEHATPHQVHAAVKDFGVGLTSVYRNLELLAQVGILRQVCFHDGYQRYEPVLPGDHHHHLICSGCGKVVKFFNCDLDKLEEQLAAETGYVVDRHMLQVFGYCRRCQKDR